MLLRQIALVSESKCIEFRQLAAVSAAIQKQVTRDFAPIWEIRATVDPFASREDVPFDYWPIFLQDDIHTAQASGVHRDRLGQPFSLVKAAPQWSLAVSHECLEMLADPFGNHLVAGFAPQVPSASTGKTSSGRREARAANPASAASEAGSNRVEFLVEVCDPCEDVEFAYQVNGILVSDFYTPHYFDPVAGPGVRYDFRGVIHAPREVLKNGYLSWHDPLTDEWFQMTCFGQPKINPLGRLERRVGSLRAWIDARTPVPFEEKIIRGDYDTVQGAAGVDYVWGGEQGCATGVQGDYAGVQGDYAGVQGDYGNAGTAPAPPDTLADRDGVQGFREAMRRDAQAMREDIERAKRSEGYE